MIFLTGIDEENILDLRKNYKIIDVDYCILKCMEITISNYYLKEKK